MIFLSVLTRVFSPALQRLFQPNINKFYQLGLATFFFVLILPLLTKYTGEKPLFSPCHMTYDMPQLWGPESKNICLNKVQCFSRSPKWKSLEVSHTDNTLKEALETIHIWKCLSTVLHSSVVFTGKASASANTLQTMITLRGQAPTTELFSHLNPWI